MRDGTGPRPFGKARSRPGSSTIRRREDTGDRQLDKGPPDVHNRVPREGHAVRDDPARFDVERYVLPDHAGNGLCRNLLRLAETRVRRRLAHAPAGGRGAFVTDAVNGANAAALRLLEDEGHAPARRFLRMEIDLRGTPAGIGPAPGTTVGPCRSEAEGEAKTAKRRSSRTGASGVARVVLM